MYRNCASSDIVYTPEDLILFRESPFAFWMERLSLENPNHGIAPDPQPQCGDLSAPASPVNQSLLWEDFVNGVAGDAEQTEQVEETADELAARTFVEHLRAEGKSVASIADCETEAERESATLHAMETGVEYLVDAHLALGPLSCTVDLLTRAPGASELGNYYYLPCSTGINAGRNTMLHLCFAADLLQSLQGLLPTQLLIMRPEADMECLNVQDHISRFRELKYQFMTAQLSFRKHRMPDPAQSSHFGRWSNFAQTVLRERADASQEHASASLPDNIEACANEGTHTQEQTVAANRAAGFGLAAAMDQAIARSAGAATRQNLVDHDIPRLSDYLEGKSSREVERKRRYG